MKPFHHQEKEFNEHWATPARALLWGMRTGKSKSVIDIACALYQVCAIEAVLVFAPNGVHRNWTLNQLPEHHWPEVPYECYAWRTSEDIRLTEVAKVTLTPGLAWFTVNMEILMRKDVKVAVQHFIKQRRNVLLVVDESHHFAQPGSKRTKILRTLAKRTKYRRILTGTVNEDSPFQNYSQFQILQEGGLGFNRYEDYQNFFADFEDSYAGGRKHEVVKNYKNLDVLTSRMAPFASVVLREDCEDLPEIMPDVRIAELSDMQRRYYDILKDPESPAAARALIKLGFDKPPTGGALLTKLQQIEGGYLLTPTGLKILSGEHEKFNIVLEEIQSYHSLIWCVYTHEIEEIAKKLRTRGFKPGIIHGQAPDREAVLLAFKEGRVSPLIAQPRAIGEGYQIGEAQKAIWYSQTPVARIRAQANERITQIGTGKKQMVDIYFPTGMDEYCLKLTRTKTTMADDVARRGLKAILEGLGK